MNKMANNEFKNKVLEIEEMFPKGAIIDGLTEPDVYFQAPIKIAWMLKEAYTTEEEGFHMKKYYSGEDRYENFFKNVATQTWHPIIYSTFGILNDFIFRDQMPTVKEKPEMCEMIDRIAIINASKMPSVTGTYTLNGNLVDGHVYSKKIVMKQLDVFRPTIRIYANTFHLYQQGLEIDDSHIQPIGLTKTNLYINKGVVHIDAYHPAQTQITRDVYVNEIILAAKKGLERLGIQSPTPFPK